MGLDMYLSAKRYLWHNEEDLAKKISANFPELGDKRVKEIIVEAAYWRKCNQIHKWFVDNVQDGVDDCQGYDVSRDKIKELLDLIDKVLANRGKASVMLPNQQGFFFGSDQYDDYYFDDLEYTKTMLTPLLDEENWKGWYFEYRASW